MIVARRTRGRLGLTGKLERGLFDTPLALQVVALLTPVLGDRDGVAVTLDFDQKFGVVRRDVDPVDDFGFLDEPLQLGD